MNKIGKDTIIPATPGTYSIWTERDEHRGLDIIRSPVIAWAFTREVDAENCSDSWLRGPLTARRLDLVDEHYTILHPCGLVEEHSGRSWGSIDE